MIQQSHFWVYNQRKWKQNLKEIYALPCLLQRYSLESSCGNKLCPQQMNGYRRYVYSAISFCLQNKQTKNKENPAIFGNMDGS